MNAQIIAARHCICSSQLQTFRKLLIHRFILFADD